jgi:hypothetical protein
MIDDIDDEIDEVDDDWWKFDYISLKI